MTPPRIQIQDSSAAFLVGFGKHKFKLLEERRKENNEPVAEEFFKVDEFLVHVRSSLTHNFVRITGGKFSGFLSHPRNGAVAETRFNIYAKTPSYEGHSVVSGNGYNPKGESLPDGPYAYPLVDDDHGTRGVQLKSEEWKERKDPPENYGNIDWKGPKGEVLTWKGPPSRYFPLNQYLEIPGLTQLDYYIESPDGDYSQFTPFSKNIYRSGKVYAVAPDVWYPQSDAEVDHGGQVLGAALNSGKLVIIVKAIFTVHPSTPRSGNYYQAYLKDGKEWVLLGERYLSFKPRVPFFFNQSGTEAQSVDGGSVWKVVIDTDTLSATFTSSSSTIEVQEAATTATTTTDEAGELRALMPDVTSVHGMGPTDIHPAWWFPYDTSEAGYSNYILPLNGKKGTEVETVSSVSVTKEGRQIIAVDYKGDVPVFAYIVTDGTERTDFTRRFCAAVGLGGIWGNTLYVDEDDPATHVLGSAINITEPMSVGDVASIDNACNGRWSISKGSIDSITGKILSLPCTTGSAAYATITYTSKLGTRSRVVRFAGGVWVYLSTTSQSGVVICTSCGSTGRAGYACSISGGLGYNYEVMWGRKDTTYTGCPAYCGRMGSGRFNSDPYPTGVIAGLGTTSPVAPAFGTYSCTCGGNCNVTSCGVTISLEPCGACFTEWIYRRNYEWRCP